MNLTIIMDGRFKRTSGVPSSNHMHYERFAKGYTSVFSHVTIIARVLDEDDPHGQPLAGPKTSVQPLPPIRGMSGLLKHFIPLMRTLFSLPRDSAYILRIPGIIPTIAWLVLSVRRIPYGVEVVADPADAFSPTAVKHPLRPIIRIAMITVTRLQCAWATASAYVTAHLLQRRYPPGRDRPTHNYTDVNLTTDAFVKKSLRDPVFRSHPLHLVNIGSMQKFMKGQDLLLRAIADLKPYGLSPKLSLIGVSAGDKIPQ